MADDESSELSSLSSLSAPPSEDESDIQLEKKHGILKFFHKVDKTATPEEREATPPRAKREPSPPHEYTLADNPDVAYIVMFRARFSDAFPKSLPNFGPQELEFDVVQSVPGERAELFVCALLSLLLNRKQDVKPGHYNRALEEAVQTHKAQWARDWEEQSPLAGGANFTSMTPVQRLTLIRTLIQWTLSSSDAIKKLVTHAYKNRQDDDLNIELSVQPWGSDGDKRRYFLIEGKDDTAFRVYRESNPAGFERTWWCVAGTIEELNTLAEKLETADGGPKARMLAKRIKNSIPRFEASEEKRRRREYRQMRKEAFRRPEPGFSMYEGRTRGKRMKYTYSDDEDFLTDSTNRRSMRNTRNHTPAEPAGPVTTASGRQIRAPNRLNAETASNGAPSVSGSIDDAIQDVEMREDSIGPTGRPRRSAAVNHGTNGWAPGAKRKSASYDSDEDEGSEPDYGDDEEEEHVPDDEELDEEEFEDDGGLMDEDLGNATEERHIVKLPVKKAKAARPVHHRNVIDSDDDEEDDDVEEPRYSSGATDTSDFVVMEPEGEAKDVISVALKQATPNLVAKAQDSTPVKSPLTPSSGPSTALAFRGSPDKPPQHISRPIDIGLGD